MFFLMEPHIWISSIWGAFWEIKVRNSTRCRRKMKEKNRRALRSMEQHYKPTVKNCTNFSNVNFQWKHSVVCTKNERDIINSLLFGENECFMWFVLNLHSKLAFFAKLFYQFRLRLYVRMHNLFDFSRICFRFIGFNSSMRRCARSAITPPIFTIINRNMDYFEVLRPNHDFSTDKSANHSSSPIHSSRSNGIW